MEGIAGAELKCGRMSGGVDAKSNAAGPHPRNPLTVTVTRIMVMTYIARVVHIGLPIAIVPRMRRLGKNDDVAGVVMLSQFGRAPNQQVAWSGVDKTVDGMPSTLRLWRESLEELVVLKRSRRRFIALFGDFGVLNRGDPLKDVADELRAVEVVDAIRFVDDDFVLVVRAPNIRDNALGLARDPIR